MSRCEPGDALQSLMVYGCTLSADIDLGNFLSDGGAGQMSLVLSAVKEGLDTPELSQRYPLLTSHGRDIALYTDRELADSVQGQPWRFVVEGVVSFYWVGGSTKIRYQCQEACTDKLLAFWFIHIFLPLFFTLEAVYEFIHACAVGIRDETVLFIAPSHGGKSTLTDYFLRQGHMLVSDDKVATYLEGGKYWAVPSHPNHRPYRSFEDLGNRVDEFITLPTPVGAIYNLVRSDAESVVEIEEVKGHEKFSGMLPNYLFNFSYLKAKRLEYLGQMANTVPLYRVTVPWNLERLDDVYRAISRHRDRV